MKQRVFVLIIVLATLLITPSLAQDANLTDGCATTYDPNVDYFPEKITVDYAEGFEVEYRRNFKLVTVNSPWQGAEAPIRYVLVQCGTPAPDDVPEDVLIIDVPVKTIVAMSTSFLPYLDHQGLIDRLIGLDTFLYTNTPSVVEKIEAGELKEVGGGGSGTEINVELLLELEPGLIMTQRFSAEDTTYPIIEEAGLPVVLNADFLDTSPLGQAEWGKFIALFFNTEARAQSDFEDVVTRYQALKELAATAQDRPTVFANTPYSGTWFMPGGQSYLPQLLADAGASYLWADDESRGALFLDFETVYDKAIDADFWVNVNQSWTTVEEALADDPRYADFAAFQHGNVYNNNARMNANGGNDYFESGFANPDVILADLIKIFHPELLPDHELVYYRKLTSE